MINLEDSVGYKVAVTTSSDKVVRGVIHSYNPRSGILSLVDSAPGARGYSKSTTFKVIDGSFIKSISRLDKPAASANSSRTSVDDKFRQMDNRPAPVNVAAIGDRFSHGNSKTIARQEREFNRRRILGDRRISAEGEAVFNQLYKMLHEGDVTFDKKDSIVIFGNHIAVMKPYRAENCRVVGSTGEKDDQQLSYIRKVIRDIWDKLESERKGG